MEKSYYTVQEIIALLHISRPTVYKMIADGRFDAAKIGKHGSWLIDALSIPSFIRNANLPLDKP